MSSEEPPARRPDPAVPPQDLRPRLRYPAGDEDPLTVVRDTDFPVVFRGYAREQVDAFVARISELIAELDASRSPESAVKAALDRVGEETSGILQRARETAEEITARSRAQADDRVQVAEAEARSIRAEADARVEELDDDIEALWRERSRLLEEVRRVAGELAAVATAAEERTPPSSEAVPRSDAPPEETTAEIASVGEAADIGEEPTDPGEEPVDPGEEPTEPGAPAPSEGPIDRGDDPTLGLEGPDRRS